MVVKTTLEKLELHPLSIELGEIDLKEDDISSVKAQLTQELQALGFDLLSDTKSKTIEKIKTIIVDLIQNKNGELSVPLSDYLSRELSKDYSAISNLFSEVEGITIEKYYILQKVEKVKELLMYDELNLNEIADKLNYSSAAYLSNQFKKITGSTPGNFKKQRSVPRKSLEEL